MRYHPKLPLKFILLWILNLALLLTVFILTGFHGVLMKTIHLKNLTYLYLGAGAVLALLEQALWDRLKGG